MFISQAKLEATDRHGQTALNLAARHGYSDVVKVLLTAGANVDHADCDGWTALRAAAWGGHTKVILFFHAIRTPMISELHYAILLRSWNNC